MTAPTFVSAHPCRSCLMAAKAPANWRRELSRKTTPSNLIRRTCDWIASLPRGAVKLQPEPLLGSCLAELTGNDHHAGTPTVQRASQPRPALPPSSLQRPLAKSQSVQQPSSESDSSSCQPQPRWRRQPAPGQKTDPCSAQEPLKLEPKANSELLCRLVSKAEPSRIKADSVSPQPEPATAASLPATSNPCLPASKPVPAKGQEICPPEPRSPQVRNFYQPPQAHKKVPIPACLEATHQREWLDRLAQHTTHRWRREGLATPGCSTLQPLPSTRLAAQQLANSGKHQGLPVQPPTFPLQKGSPEQLPISQEFSSVHGADCPTPDQPLPKNPLLEQWFLPIAGQTASMDLLVYLADRVTDRPRATAGLPSQRGSNTNPEFGSDDPNRGTVAPPTATLPASGEVGQSLERWFTPAALKSQGTGVIPLQNPQTPRSDAGPVWASHPPGQAQVLPQPTLAASSAIHTNGNGFDAFPALTRDARQSFTPTAGIEPPAVTPTLPPLTAPQAGESSAPSVAAALTQHQAQLEEIAPIDLGILADQIQCILSEEARRHGINL